MREPAFWWRRPTLAARLLAPAAAVYGAVAAARLTRRGRPAGVPVICVGNLTVGGAGKTPTAIAVAQLLAAEGERLLFLSRGYGGSERGPLQVDLERHGAAEVGDEPLLLARTAATVVARDRVSGARMAKKLGAGVIVMDDGFQNPSLTKDLSVLVIDGRRGIGNGRVIPAGPLRAPLAIQLRRAQALLVVGAQPHASGAGAEAVLRAARARGLATFAARLEPDASFVTALGSGRVLAFAGIGDPEKFFATLAAAGVSVVARRSFPDHHRYTRAEAERLCEEADREGLVLVTTEKDAARFARDAEAAQLAALAHALPVRLVFDEEERFRSFLLERLALSRVTEDR
jgi:tetraacyldisaccharide 4'-kinase